MIFSKKIAIAKLLNTFTLYLKYGTYEKLILHLGCFFISSRFKQIFIHSILRIISGLLFIGRKTKKHTAPLIRIGKKIIRKYFLNGILNTYFTGIKLKRQARSLSFSRQHKLFSWLNRYILRFTVAVIVIVTLSNNIFAQTLPLEDIESQSRLTALLSPADDIPAALIEEGPLSPAQVRSPVTNYLDENTLISNDVIAIPFADADNEPLYATAEGQSAIIAPTPTNLNALEGSRRSKIETYVVQSGDTISTIAEQFNLNSNSVLWQNNLAWSSTIRPGQSLTILPTDGLTHVVKSGDTISAIAKKYQVDNDTIIEFNKLASASDIKAGDTLIVPNGIKPNTVRTQPRSQPVGSILKNIFEPIARDSGSKLLWPLGGRRITQYFHFRHSGLDIGDKSSQPIYAAESGRVERSGWTSGYGYNIIINHGDGLKTLYAHSSTLLVNVGDTVSRGQTIARIGSTGRSTGPHLHFETIVGGRKVNPLNYLR